MGIYHATSKVSGERGYHTEWNAGHVIEDVSKPKTGETLIVAASDSRDTSRADYVCGATDAQDVINQAITDMPAVGGLVQLLEGTFQITNTIDMIKANIELRGLGYGTKILTNSNVIMIHNNARHHVALRNLYLYGAGAGKNANVGIKITNSDYVSIMGCYITNCGIQGIYTLTSIGYMRIMHNILLSNKSHGMRLANFTEGDVSHNSVIRNESNGIYVQSGINNIITGNRCIENDFSNTATFDGINLSGSSWNIVSNNRCMDNDGFEINIWDAGCIKNIVHGNHVQGGAHVGTIQDNGTNTMVADNIS